MARVLLVGCALLAASFSRPAAGAEAPGAAPPDHVHPAAYRILVTYDDYTMEQIREQIRKEVKKALEARRRRLKLSREEVEERLEKELDKFDDELRAIRKARTAEEKARARGDLTEAERWRMLRLERTHRALELARRARLAQEALLALSLENWRNARRRERAIARKTLRRLEELLAEIEAREAKTAPAPALPPE